MNSKYPYALYLDSKILGTARQLISFYDQGIFSAENTIIYLKKYKESYRKFSLLFATKGIPFKFMKPRELDALTGQTIFYAFNAQSNCRFVANRNLKHIFITHGESNKVSSVKPIIRIYDHVIMAGKLSLERYYRSGLFDQHDVETKRLIMMGDTFIGRTGFSSDKSCKPALFYAPTWEGGLESENYSSLVNIDLVYEVLVTALKELRLKTIVVKPHPNLGHRLPTYEKKLVNLLCKLASYGYTVKLKSNGLLFSYINKFKMRRNNIYLLDNMSAYCARLAFVDVSAMESQCINECINYRIFYRPSLLRNDMSEKYLSFYKKKGISLDYIDINHKSKDGRTSFIKNDLCDFTVSLWDRMSKKDRIDNLVEFINE